MAFLSTQNDKNGNLNFLKIMLKYKAGQNG